MAEIKVLTVGAAGPTAKLVIPELRTRGAFVRGLVHKEEIYRLPSAWAHNKPLSRAY
jgi:hypothetical protein